MKIVSILSVGIFLSSLFSIKVHAQESPDPSLPSLPALSATSSEDSQYVLGPGDQLYLSFFNVPEYDGEEQILVDGSVNLPLIGKLTIAGMTLEEATQAIEVSYSDYLKTPLIAVDLVAPRPIKIGVSGEVNRPGAYEISLVDNGSEWPTVVDAIQLSGGITDQANVRHVEIHRFQSSQDAQVIQVDFWDVLTTGNIQNDITLRHGDAIYVPTATALTPEELTQLSAANFAPDNIRVTVVGEVPNPGAVDIPPNAPLNQALLAAGGFDPRRAKTDEVELVRLNPDGTVSQRKISVSFDQGINEEGNPSLRNNDVVLVGRSARTTFADNVGGVLGPVGVILSPIRLLLNLLD